MDFIFLTKFLLEYSTFFWATETRKMHFTSGDDFAYKFFFFLGHDSQKVPEDNRRSLFFTFYGKNRISIDSAQRGRLYRVPSIILLV